MHSLIPLLAAVMATAPLAMQIFLPALPIVQEEFATTTGMVQLTLSLSMVAVALCTLGYGPASDRFGRKPVLLVGLVVFVAGSLLCALALTVEFLIFGRIVQAAGAAAGMVLVRAVVRDLSDGERAAAVIARLTMVMGLALMVAPLIGGVLTDALNWRSVFLFTALMVFAVFLWVIWRLPETHPNAGGTDGSGGPLRGLIRLLGSSHFLGYVGHTAFSSVIFFSFISSAPYLMVSVLGRSATEYGFWFVLLSVGFMLGNFIAIRASGRFSRLGLMLAGSLVVLLSIAVISVCVLVDVLSPLTLFGPVSVAMIGSGLAMPNAQAGALSVFPRWAGTASGFSGFTQMAAAAVATQAVGIFQNGTAWPMLGCMMMGSCGTLVALMLVVRVERVHYRPA